MVDNNFLWNNIYHYYTKVIIFETNFQNYWLHSTQKLFVFCVSKKCLWQHVKSRQITRAYWLIWVIGCFMHVISKNVLHIWFDYLLSLALDFELLCQLNNTCFWLKNWPVNTLRTEWFWMSIENGLQYLNWIQWIIIQVEFHLVHLFHWHM